jgi:hypothetical protein
MRSDGLPSSTPAAATTQSGRQYEALFHEQPGARPRRAETIAIRPDEIVAPTCRRRRNDIILCESSRHSTFVTIGM